MRIEHLNLLVADIDLSLGFFQAALPHWRLRQRGQSNWYGEAWDWVHFGDDTQYLTFNAPGGGRLARAPDHCTGMAHFGLETHNLDALVRRLADAGFQPSSDGNPTAQRRNIYYVDPNGLEVEFVEYRSDLPSERNA